MRLKKLEIYGFKSFADRTQVTFEDGITGIVGPNGCGKSNISDAMRWVLGEQSAKQLRGGKMEDVIFNGTEKRRRLATCEVVLTFDNKDHQLPVAFAEVEVARRVYRSGESEYAINRAPCRLKDIVDMFRDTGIGKEGYSIIGQGRVDEILSARSEDRRQIFEEAAGIVKYKVRKNEAERRMDNTRDNLSRVEDILHELEQRLEPLRQQSEVAREYLSLREELKKLELNLFLLRTERYQERSAALQASQTTYTQSLNDIQSREAALTRTREDKQAELDALETRATQSRTEVEALIHEVEARDGAAGVLRERIASAQRDYARVEAEVVAAMRGSEGVEEALAQSRKAIEDEGKTVSALQHEQETLARDADEQSAALAREEQSLEDAKSAIIDQMNRLSDARSEASRLSALRDQLTQRIDSMREDEAQDAGRLDEFTAREKQCHEQLLQEQEEKARLDRLAADAVERVKALGEEGITLNEILASRTSERQELSSRLNVLQEMKRDYEGYQFAVKNVLTQAQRTGASGVHGVVATLIHAPKELERALDMALGAQLQHIVVDREEDAKRLIDYLRNNRLGRATFLPLSAVKGRVLDARERHVLSMEGCVGLASELVAFAPKYRGIVESLLGRTVIAKDLDAGIRIMRAGNHQFRLVTLEGDVMHSGGSMTGGSTQSRMTSLLSREREINEHQARLRALETELQQAREKTDALEEARGELKRERASLFDQLHQQEIACTRAEAHLASAREELHEQQSRAGRTGVAQAQLQEQLSDTLCQLEALASHSAEATDQRERGQADVARLQERVVSMRSALGQAQKALADKRVSLAAKERDQRARLADFERMSAQKNDITRLLREGETQQTRLRETLQSDRAQLARDEEALATYQTSLQHTRDAFNALDQARKQAQDELRIAGETLDALRAESATITERAHRVEIALSRLESEFTQSTQRIWEDYEMTYEGAQEYRDPSFKLTDSEKRIAQIRARVKQMGSVNVASVDEYRETSTRFESLSGQRDDLIKATLDLEKIIEELSTKMETQFRREFEKLNTNFQQTFQKLFGGGVAQLRLEDPKDALASGIEIVAQPPGKKLQMLSLLSGGERALTAIAILFAMLMLKPTPFCFLDEIEAALDDANIDNFAEYLKSYSCDTQFVVVTHRKGTMERCDALYGVAMEEKGVSKLVSVQLRDALKAG